MLSTQIWSAAAHADIWPNERVTTAIACALFLFSILMSQIRELIFSGGQRPVYSRRKWVMMQQQSRRSCTDLCEKVWSAKCPVPRFVCPIWSPASLSEYWARVINSICTHFRSKSPSITPGTSRFVFHRLSILRITGIEICAVYWPGARHLKSLKMGEDGIEFPRVGTNIVSFSVNAACARCKSPRFSETKECSCTFVAHWNMLRVPSQVAYHAERIYSNCKRSAG